MDITRQTSICLQPGRTITNYELPQYLIFPTASVLVSICILALMTTVMTLTRNETLIDPFLFYTDIFPSQAKHTLVERGFACSASTYTGELCTLHPNDGPFSHVYVHISDDHISPLNFIMRKNQLTAGDLILWWGKPQIQVSGLTIVLKWADRQAMVATTPSQQQPLSYFLPVTLISISNPNAPVDPPRLS